MKRFYVTLTWEDWPEGGSYGTVIVDVDNEVQALASAKLEMAVSRTEAFKEITEGVEDMATPEYWLENYGEAWEVVDCFDLDEFIQRHDTRKPTRAELIEANDAAMELVRAI